MNDVWFVLVMAIVTPTLSTLLNPQLIIKTLKKWWLKRTLHKSNYIQSEANELYEGVDYSLSDAMANLAKSVMNVMFYLPILPIGAVFGMLAILALHMAERILLLRMSKCPPSVNAKLARSMYDLFDVCLIVYAVSLMSH